MQNEKLSQNIKADSLAEEGDVALCSSYLDAVGMVEKLHRRYLEVVKSELDRQGIQDINNVQALIVYNIGDEELTVGELTLRGCYHGSNVSYNLKKLVDCNYVSHKRSIHDRRSYRVHLTPKGKKVSALMAQMLERHASLLHSMGLKHVEVMQLADMLHRLDRFLSAPDEGFQFMDQSEQLTG